MQAFLANQITAALAPLLPKGYPVTGDDINELLLGVELPDGTVFGGVAFLTTSPKRILVPTVFVAFQGGTFKGFSNLWNEDGAITLFFSQPQPLEWQEIVAYSSGGGGGNASVIVVSSLEEYPTFDERIVGKDNICQKLGITSKDFDDIADGKILAIRIGHHLLGAVWGELRGYDPDVPDAFSISFGWLDSDSGLCDLNFGYNNGDYYLDGRSME